MHFNARLIAAVSVAGLLSVTTACGGGSASAGGQGDTIDLVAYSTPEAAYTRIEQLFNKTAKGQDVGFSSSYGPSRPTARANRVIVARSMRSGVGFHSSFSAIQRSVLWFRPRRR